MGHFSQDEKSSVQDEKEEEPLSPKAASVNWDSQRPLATDGVTEALAGCTYIHLNLIFLK